MTELDPWADERAPEPPEADGPPWGLALVAGAALIPLGWVVPKPVAVLLWLLVPAAVGGLTSGSAFLAGAAVGIPGGLALVVVAVANAGLFGVLGLMPAAMYVFFNGLLGSGGEFVLRNWFDRSSEDPETRERARRGMIIVAAAALLIGGPMAASAYSDERADERAEAVERRLLTVTRASVPFDGFLFARVPANPISSAVPDVHIIGTSVGANMQAEVGWGLSTRCVMVQVQDTEVTSRIAGDACGALVGG